MAYMEAAKSTFFFTLDRKTMESKARLLGHSVHQMLVPIPIGLFVMATACDVTVMAGYGPGLANVAFCNLVVGVCAALAAALFGAIDLTAIPRQSRAARIGLIHGLGNLLAVALFAGSVILRWNTVGHAATTIGFALEVPAILLAGVAAFLGGELVVRLGVGVDDHAHVNAPSSRAVRRHFAARKTQP